MKCLLTIGFLFFFTMTYSQVHSTNDCVAVNGVNFKYDVENRDGSISKWYRVEMTNRCDKAIWVTIYDENGDKVYRDLKIKPLSDVGQNFESKTGRCSVEVSKIDL